MRVLSPFLVSVLLTVACVGGAASLEGQTPVVASNDVRPQVLDRLAKQLVSYFQVDGTLLLELQRPWNPPGVVEGWEVNIAEYPKDLNGTMIARIRLISNGEIVSEPTLVLRAQLMRDVYYAKTPLEREALFDRNILDVRNVDVLRERDPVAVSAQVQDMIYNRAIPLGRLITWSDLSRRPMVRRGEMIEVAATDGVMTIVLRGQALDNGSAGDVVRVRNVESRKDFNAFVIADKRAEVRF